MASQSGKVHIGTSGWNYGHWKGSFYPEELNQEKWLDFYKSRFRTVEINNSFYNLPEKKTFRSWKETVQKDFIFSVKASRYITHMKKLKDPEEPVERFLSTVKELGKNLGPILFQLPPHWNVNHDRLKSFLNTLPPGNRYTIEFRDESWWTRETYDLLKDHAVAWCIFHLAGSLTPKEVTADFVYIRLHGPEGAYEGQYDGNTLGGWAGAINSWKEQGKDVFCYFDNDQNGYAAQDALKLKEMFE